MIQAQPLQECLFCKIVEKEVDAEMVLETDDFVVIKDINPKAPVHLLVIPKTHLESLNDLEDAHVNLTGEIMLAIKNLAKQYNIAKDGYRVIVNTNKHGGQEIPHLHFHLIGGKPLGPMISI